MNKRNRNKTHGKRGPGRCPITETELSRTRTALKKGASRRQIAKRLRVSYHRAQLLIERVKAKIVRHEGRTAFYRVR